MNKRTREARNCIKFNAHEKVKCETGAIERSFSIQKGASAVVARLGGGVLYIDVTF